MHDQINSCDNINQILMHCWKHNSKTSDSEDTRLEQQSLFWSVLLTLLVLDLALDIVNGV